MSALAQLTANVSTKGADNPSKPLGTLASGAALLSMALGDSYPGCAEILQTLEGGYNGSIDVLGEQVPIKNGIGDIEGNKIYVSPNGEVVADDTGKIMGRVENGKFVVIDKQQVAMLEKNKQAERGAK